MRTVVATPAPVAHAMVDSYQPALAPVRVEAVQSAVQVVMVPQTQPSAVIPVAAASDTGTVRLARVERRMPTIMIDRKGGVFHM